MKTSETRTKQPFRSIPDICLSPVEKGYATLVASGWDTVAETFNVKFKSGVVERLDHAKAHALELDERGEGRALIQFGGEELQVSPYGGRGVVYWLANDDFAVIVRSPKTDWCVTIRYSAAGLWEEGLVKLRGRALAALLREAGPVGEDWQRVSEAHWAFDFYSPSFTGEMKPGISNNVICHSSTKSDETAEHKQIVDFKTREITKRVRAETLYIGQRKPLEICIYDKGREINEKSGKTWMVRLWEQNGMGEGFFPDGERIQHVWRVEIRMRGDFLKDRGCKNLADVTEHIQQLLTEAIVTRRLTSPTSDSNRWRWPLHPMWTVAYQEVGELRTMRPLGRQITTAGDALERQLIRQAAGTLRAITVLNVGGYDEVSANRKISEIWDALANDEGHERKVEVLEERYRYVNCARG